jgi:hypothetical protein
LYKPKHKTFMKQFLLIVCILLSFSRLDAQQVTIGDSAVVSLITCSPGEEVYSKFGHTAIRVKDKINNVDVVFNYGIFSFETEHFYYKFIKGETDYQLGIYDTNFFLPEYAERNSMVWEQVLNLTSAEKKNLVATLLENYEPQNRIYRYNFVFDNCSTRPRDKITSSVDGYIRYHQTSEPTTFRRWVGDYVGTDTWLKFGIDLIFGIDADAVASQKESQFLPEVLMSDFQEAEIVTLDGKSRKLVEKSATVLVDKKHVETTTSIFDFLLKPLAVSLFLLILGVLITLLDIKYKKHNKIFDSILLFITGIAGVIAFYLMVFSTHPLVASNLNILWINPLNMIVAFLIWIKPLRKILFVCGILNLGLLAATLITFSLSIQSFNLAAFPIIVLLMLRSSHWVDMAKKKIFKNKEVTLDNFKLS